MNKSSDEVIELTDLTEAQEAIVEAFIREGKLRVLDTILSVLNEELNESAPDDPQYGSYVESVIEKILDIKLSI